MTNLLVENINKTADYTLEESKIQSHIFTEEICDSQIIFQIIKLKESLFIYIGLFSEAKFHDLSMAVKTPYDNLPLSTKLFGEGSDLTSANLSIKMAKKLNRPVYISFNLPMDNIIIPAIEKRLNAEISKHPDKFL